MASNPGDLRVLVVAADPLVRAGLGAMLDGQPGCLVVGQVAGAPDLSSTIDIYRPEAVVWDLGWDPALSLEWLSDVSETGPPVIVLLPDDAYLGEVLATGARGMMLRDSSPEALAAALNAVAQGLTVFHPHLVLPPLPAPDSPQAPPIETLTRRETEVLQLLAEGLPNKSIADHLSITEHTVKFHVNSIMGKLGAQSRTEAVTRATRLGLLLL